MNLTALLARSHTAANVITSILRFYSSSARFVAAHSDNPCARSAVVEAASDITKRMQGTPPSLVLLFANAAHYGVEVGQLASVSASLRQWYSVCTMHEAHMHDNVMSIRPSGSGPFHPPPCVVDSGDLPS